VNRGGPSQRPLTAEYCGFKTSAGIRKGKRRGEIKPVGQGSRNRLLFAVGDLCVASAGT
jgi:hypothetical protein